MGYDSWKTTAPEDDREPPQGCPVCTGDETAEPCSEECASLVSQKERRVRIRGLYLTCRSALRWARLYIDRGECDARVRALVDEVNKHRKSIRVLRAA